MRECHKVPEELKVVETKIANLQNNIEIAKNKLSVADSWAQLGKNGEISEEDDTVKFFIKDF